MTILNDAQRRVLTFIQAANHGRYSPTPEEVTEWVEHPELKFGKVTRRKVEPPQVGPVLSSKAIEAFQAEMAESWESVGEQISRALQPISEQLASYANPWSGDRFIEESEPDETVIEQVQRFGWTRSSSTGAGLVLTDLGRALLRADTDLTTASVVTVLDGKDPLAWSGLVGIIAEAGKCLIVDPYLKLAQLLDIARFTGTTRVILRRPQRQRELVSWQVSQKVEDFDVEIRMADPDQLHDRYIVGENAVYTLGCSLNGVGSKPTTLVPLTGAVADHVRDLARGWWESADPVGDPPAVDEEEEPDQKSEQDGTSPDADSSEPNPRRSGADPSPSHALPPRR
ncbi:hypothetical protein [Mycolicibacterium sp. XJ1819]